MTSYDSRLTHDTAREAAEDHAEQECSYNRYGVCVYCGETAPDYPDDGYDEDRDREEEEV